MMKNDFLTLFYQAVKQQPHKIALQLFSEKLTYKQLDLLSNKVAMTIRKQAIKPNSPIILEVNKALISIVYILGILKAGCYYIPISSNSPIKRLRYLLENSQCQIAFLSHCYNQLNAMPDLNCFLIQKKFFQMLDNEESNPAIERIQLQHHPTDPFCCLYTSGSTGNPKGVLISHVGVATFIAEIKPYMNISHHSICLNTAPFIFDVSIIDTFFPLAIGATVYISPEIILPRVILRMIDQERITHICAVSSTINLLFGNALLLSKYNISSLITVMTGAELLHQKTLVTLLKHSPQATIINGYGLTETTCVVIAYKITTDNVYHSALYPIGKPLPSIDAKILFANGTEDGRGELLLSGDQIMLQYLNNREANAKAFIEYDGKIYLKTGDIVSYDKNENFIFHGRNDTQVKVNGYRVDLNEVKYTLLSMQNVNEVEVFMKEARVVAILSLKPSRDATNEELMNNLKQELNNSLPKYMQPKEWMVLEKIPKLSTGKTDLKKLRMHVD